MFCELVNAKLNTMGIDKVRVANSVHAAMQRSQKDGMSVRLGKVQVTSKYTQFSENTSENYLGALSEVAVKFKGFNDLMATIEKKFTANFDSDLAIPVQFVDWLNKHKTAIEKASPKVSIKKDKKVKKESVKIENTSGLADVLGDTVNA